MSFIRAFDRTHRPELVREAEIKDSSNQVSHIYHNLKWQMQIKDHTPDGVLELFDQALDEVDQKVKNGGLALSARTALLEMKQKFMASDLYKSAQPQAPPLRNASPEGGPDASPDPAP